MNISQNIHLLGDLLGKVISELESPELFETEERIRRLAKPRRGKRTEDCFPPYMDLYIFLIKIIAEMMKVAIMTAHRRSTCHSSKMSVSA